jgi:hypothetical protein
MKPIRSSLAILGALVASACASSYADSNPVLSDMSGDVRACGMERPASYSPYGVDILGADSQSLPTYRYRARTYTMGVMGERYVIHLTNRTARRVEAVVSVDGLDAVDGRAADFQSKRGYLIPAYGDVTIEGFRTSVEQVAAFRFSSVADSYAGRKGQPRDVGIIGVAFFSERERRPVPPPAPLSVAPRYDPPRASASPAPAPSAPEDAATGAASAQSRSGAPEKRRRDSEPRASRELERPGLGTEFGEQRWSSVEYTTFQRQNPSHPASIVEVRYNDRRGLMALGIPVDGCWEDDVAARETAEPFRADRFAAPPPPR